MRQVIFSSMVLTVLVAVTGCGASTARVHQPSRSVEAIEVDSSAWNPPEEMSFTMSESSIKQRASNVASGLPSPNRRDATYGMIHAAY